MARFTFLLTTALVLAAAMPVYAQEELPPPTIASPEVSPQIDEPMTDPRYPIITYPCRGKWFALDAAYKEQDRLDELEDAARQLLQTTRNRIKDIELEIQEIRLTFFLEAPRCE